MTRFEPNLLIYRTLKASAVFVQCVEQIVQSKVTPILLKGPTDQEKPAMISTLYHELFSSTDGGKKPAGGSKSRLGDQLDEIAVFALVAVAIFYIAVASCWFLM
jgi:hypothetical protein